MRGSLFLLSKANKNSARAPQSEDKVPFKAVLPLALRNRVSGKTKTDKEKGCLHEISIVLACLAKNNYENKNCTEEVSQFNKCFNRYTKKIREVKANREKGVLTPNTTVLNHQEVNMLLKKFASQGRE